MVQMRPDSSIKKDWRGGFYIRSIAWSEFVVSAKLFPADLRPGSFFWFLIVSEVFFEVKSMV